MEYLKSLQSLGLNQNEQEVYFALLQLEKATANQIAYKSGVKRPTTYDILYRLRQEGYIAETIEGKKRKFVAHSPEKLQEILFEKQRILEKDLPKLISIYNTKAKKPKVVYYEGLEGLKQLYYDSLSSLNNGDEILAYVTVKTPEVIPDYTANYVKKRVEKGISIRGLYNNSPKMRGYLKKNKEQLRTTRVLDSKKFPFENEINIYKDKIVIGTYEPEPYGIIIESKQIADTQRVIFELAWRGAKPYEIIFPNNK